VNVPQELLNRLKASQQSFALEALKRPQVRDAFEYGYRAGVVAGYDHALNVLLTLLDEEKNFDNDL
jgi:hypothetical protein